MSGKAIGIPDISSGDVFEGALYPVPERGAVLLPQGVFGSVSAAAVHVVGVRQLFQPGRGSDARLMNSHESAVEESAFRG